MQDIVLDKAKYISRNDASLSTCCITGHLRSPHWHRVYDVKQGLELSPVSGVLSEAVITNQIQSEVSISIRGHNVLVDQVSVVIFTQSLRYFALQL